MKQITLFLCILISSVVLGQKQLIGIRGGLNFTNFTSIKGFENRLTRTGFVGGITYDLMLDEKFGIGIDFLYSQRGVTDKFILRNEIGVIGEENTEMNYDYLSIPIKFGYEFGNKLKFIPKIGIVPAMALKAKITSPTYNETGMFTGMETIDHIDYVSKFDFGGMVEIGLERDISKNVVLCSSINIIHSLTPFSNSDYFDGNNMRHYGYSVTAGLKYLINLIPVSNNAASGY